MCSSDLITPVEATQMEEKRSPECLEYIVVHELVHLIEASHNSRFKALMDHFYPDWRLCRKELHSLVISS